MALFDDGNNHGQPVNQLYCLWCWCTGRLRDWELGVMLLLCVQWTFFHNKNNIRKFNTIWDLCCCYWCGPLLQWLLGNALKCFIFLFLLLCQVGKLNKQPPQQQQPRSYRWMVGQRSSQPSSQPTDRPNNPTQASIAVLFVIRRHGNIFGYKVYTGGAMNFLAL